MNRLLDKVAIVTGGGNGIGREIARMFAAEGAAVAVADIDDASAARTAEDITDRGGSAFAITADISVPGEVAAMTEKVVERYSHLDILVNNAAFTGFGRRIDGETMEARFDDLMALNVKGAWMAIHYAAPHMRRRNGSSIINIASIHALGGSFANSAYSASKGALVSGTRALAVELAADRIRVNCISPGRIWNHSDDRLMTRLGPDLFREFLELFAEKRQAMRAAEQPLPVAGLPQDIAYCAVYLASDEARFCTGANFVIDGGATAALPGQRYVPPGAQDPHEAEREIREWIGEALKKREAQAE